METLSLVQQQGGLVNGTFGWPVLNAADFPSGGPAYPLATPGIRLLLKPSADLSVLTAVYSGDPAGRGYTRDPQVCNRYGTTFSTSGGALWMGELRYEVDGDKSSDTLTASFKLGGWYHTGNFADQRYERNAGGLIVPIASPAAVNPVEHTGNWGVYGVMDVMDQTLWQSGKRSLGVSFVESWHLPIETRCLGI